MKLTTQPGKFRMAWIVSVLITLALACNLLTGISEDVQSARGTAGAAATQVRALASQAQGLATSVEESGFIKTAQSLATQEGGSFLGTARALATEAEERGVLKTVQSFATEEGGDLLGTASAMATQGVRTGAAPPDIPVVAEDTIVNFFGSETIITYLTSLGLRSVIDFYNQEMPANGWEPSPQGNVETDKIAHFKYIKLDKTADITISINPFDQKTLVSVLIQK